MLTVQEIIDIYISFFEKRGHKRIQNSPLIPENDPTTLFTSSGMQPLVPYLLGEPHPQGKRLVNVQDCFRAQDIDEVGDNRHTTFFRMLGNWSLGDYFKKEQLNWFFEFLTKELKLDPKRLYTTVFKGYNQVPKDIESVKIWEELFFNTGVDPKGKIFAYGTEENWWSRSGEPQNMPAGEPGGADSEVFFDFYPDKEAITKSNLKTYSHNGRLLEIGNSVFMEYKKTEEGFKNLPQKNVDFGGGLERLLAVVENQPDIFQTNLFEPIIKSIENETGKNYKENSSAMRIIADHFRASVFIIQNGIKPSNKEQGYILRRLIRRGLDNFFYLQGKDLSGTIQSIVQKCAQTNPELTSSFEQVKNTILEEEQNYKHTLGEAKKFIIKKYKKSDGELLGSTKISADDAFILYSTHGLSPTQIKSLGYEFNKQEFANKMEEHQKISRKGAARKFSGGLADESKETIKGHTATHLLHQTLHDILGETVKQKGSNITRERIRFDFNFERKLTDDEIKKIEEIVNQKIKENLPVKFEIMDINEAKKSGAIGLFNEKYTDKVKVYSIGNYSKEICGGPHADFTGEIKSFKIERQKSIGQGIQRIYAVLGSLTSF